MFSHPRSRGLVLLDDLLTLLKMPHALCVEQCEEFQDHMKTTWLLWQVLKEMLRFWMGPVFCLTPTWCVIIVCFGDTYSNIQDKFYIEKEAFVLRRSFSNSFRIFQSKSLPCSSLTIPIHLLKRLVMVKSRQLFSVASPGGGQWPQLHVRGTDTGLGSK